MDLILGTAKGASASNPSTARSVENEPRQAGPTTTIPVKLREHTPSVHLCTDAPCHAPGACHVPCGCPDRGPYVPSNGRSSTDVHTVPYRDGATGCDTYGAFHDYALRSNSYATTDLALL